MTFNHIPTHHTVLIRVKTRYTAQIELTSLSGAYVLSFPVHQLREYASALFKGNQASNDVQDFLVRDNRRSFRNFDHQTGAELYGSEKDVRKQLVHADKMLGSEFTIDLDIPVFNLECLGGNIHCRRITASGFCEAGVAKKTECLRDVSSTE